MPSQTISAILYAIAGLALVYLFQVRRRKLGELKPEQFPRLGKKGFAELLVLLKTAYERMLYMGVLFFPLAYTTYEGHPPIVKLFFLGLILMLFFSNIPPRNKIIKLLDRAGLTVKELREQGIWL